MLALSLIVSVAVLVPAVLVLAPASVVRAAATIAVRLVSRWAFTVVGVDRLSLQTAPENVASQRVAERAGFTREGLLRAWMPTPDGRRHSVMFSLLATDTIPEAGTVV